jgi:hypothetical protein
MKQTKEQNNEMITPLIQTYPKTKEEMTNQNTSQNTGELQEEWDWLSQEWPTVERMMVNPNHNMFRGVALNSHDTPQNS